jgi:hypothetical protein
MQLQEAIVTPEPDGSLWRVVKFGPKLLRLGLALLAATPAIFILGLVVRHGVDIPHLDEWTLAPLFF